MSLKEEYISDDEDYYNSVIKTEPSFDPLSYSQERRIKSRKRVSRFERSVIRGEASQQYFNKSESSRSNNIWYLFQNTLDLHNIG